MKENIGKPHNKASKQKCGIRKMSPWCPCWDSFPSDVFQIGTSVILSLAHCVTMKMLLYLEFLKCFSCEGGGF